MEGSSPPPTENARLLETEIPGGAPAGQVAYSWWVPYGDGLEIPPAFTYNGEAPWGTWEIVVAVLGGKPECVSVQCNATEGNWIGAESFRRMPLGRLVEDAALMAARPADEGPKKLRSWANPEEARREQAAAAARYRRVKRRPRQHIDVTDERLEEVARVYRASLPTGRPTAAVGKALGYSRSRAAALVMRARKRGEETGDLERFLPPTEPRKARG